MWGFSSGNSTVTLGLNRWRAVVVKPCTNSGRYIFPASPSFGSSIHLIFGSVGFMALTMRNKKGTGSEPGECYQWQRAFSRGACPLFFHITKLVAFLRQTLG